jgi:phosphatidylserine decarboxylase
VWPTDTIPEMEPSFKTLGRLMVDVGAMLAYHIDLYVASKLRTYEVGTLYRYIREGDEHLGRLLHYFSQPEG